MTEQDRQLLDDALPLLEHRYYNDAVFAKMVDSFVVGLNSGVCDIDSIVNAATFAQHICSYLKPRTPSA